MVIKHYSLDYATSLQSTDGDFLMHNGACFVSSILWQTELGLMWHNAKLKIQNSLFHFTQKPQKISMLLNLTGGFNSCKTLDLYGYSCRFFFIMFRHDSHFIPTYRNKQRSDFVWIYSRISCIQVLLSGVRTWFG